VKAPDIQGTAKNTHDKQFIQKKSRKQKVKWGTRVVVPSPTSKTTLSKQVYKTRHTKHLSISMYKNEVTRHRWLKEISWSNPIHKRHNKINTNYRTGRQPLIVGKQLVWVTPCHEKSHWNIHKHRTRN